MSSPRKRAIMDSEDTLIPTPENTLPIGALEDVERTDSKSSHAINISVSANAPPGLDSSPMSKDVNTLKDQVEYLYGRQKECMIALNQVVIEQKDAMSQQNVLMVTLDKAVCALKTQQDGMAISEKSIWEGIKETRNVLENSARDMNKTTTNIQQDATLTKLEFTDLLSRTTKTIQEETTRTRNDLTLMGKQFSDQMNAIVNHLDRLPEETNTVHMKQEQTEQDEQRSHRSSVELRENWYRNSDNWSWNPHGAGPSEEGKFPTIHTQNGPANQTINLTISDPPKFDVNRFESYRRDLLWWRDIHAPIEDSILITTIAVKCTEEVLKSIVSNFLEETRDDRNNRTFGKFVKVLDSHFEKTAQELALGKMSLWTNFERRGSETIRNFWLRYNRVIASLAKSGVKMPDEILFSKALASIRLEKTQLGILMSTLEAKGITKELIELQRISIKLFETSFLHATDAILKVEEGNALDPNEELVIDVVEGEEEDEVLECFSNNEGEVFEIRKVAPKTKRSRGLKTNAVNSSRNMYGTNNSSTSNAGKSQTGYAQKKNPTNLKCWRCGGNHSWRQCHLPWQKTLAFGTNNNAQMSGGKSMESAAVTTCAGNKQDCNNDQAKASCESVKSVSTENKSEPMKLTEEEWISRYNLSVDSIQMVVTTETVSEVCNHDEKNQYLLITNK